MMFKSGGLRNAAMVMGLSALAAGLSATGASAQAIIWGWGPSVSYGYYPPAPLYRPIPPRYIPAPVYPDEMIDETPRVRRLNPAQVRSMLNARGLRVTSAPTRNGGVFVADVRDRAGNERRVIIDGYYGRILQTFPAHAVREMPVPGPRYAGRPRNPDVDMDDLSPRGPVVIPGIGSTRDPALQRPRATEQKKKQPAKKTAAKPPLRAPAAIAPAPAMAAPAPLPAPPIETAIPQQQVPAAPPAAALPPALPEAPVVIPAPAKPAAIEPAPAPAPIPAPRRAATPPAEESAAPVTPPSTVAPVTGEPAPAAAPAPRATVEEPPADRPRRRVRFIKPDSPTVANPNVPGGQLVPIPEPPPVVVSPRSAEGPAPQPGSSVLE